MKIEIKSREINTLFLGFKSYMINSCILTLRRRINVNLVYRLEWKVW